MKESMYQYLESGLDDIWLQIGAGVQFVDRPSGRTVKITDIEGLHELIGRTLATQKKNLTGKEVRFLRKELLLSQATLGRLLGVTEQTVHRWEAGKADISKAAEALVRSLYMTKIDGQKSIDLRKVLEELADLEDELDGEMRLCRSASSHKWKLAS